MCRPGPGWGLFPTLCFFGTSDRAKADVPENARENQGNISGRVVRPVSDGTLGFNREDFESEPTKDQKETGMSSRVVVLDIDTCEASVRKTKLNFNDAVDIGLSIKSEASTPGTLKKLKASPGTSNAIFTEEQVELIQKLIDGRGHELTEGQFTKIISFIRRQDLSRFLPRAYHQSPILMKEFVRHGIFAIQELPKNKLTKGILLAQPMYIPFRCGLDDLTDELKCDINFLIEYSNLYGIPQDTPFSLAVFIYSHLNTTAKMKSLENLPVSFKDDDFYDELIRSGMIRLKDLPEYIKSKNEAYCLSQLSKGLCDLPEVPAQFLTKEVILDSLSSCNWYHNFESIYYQKCNVFTKDSVFFEEIMLKVVTAELETNNLVDDAYRRSLFRVYSLASKLYENDKKKFGLLLKKLVKVNPFVLNSIGSFKGEQFQELIDIAKYSLLDILSSRPEVSQGFSILALYGFFEIVNADSAFKTHVLNVVYPYFPDHGIEYLPDEIQNELDRIVLKSEAFDMGCHHILNRKLLPADPRTVIDYIERNREFLRFFNNKEYLEKSCNDPIVRKRLIPILAERLVTNKEDVLYVWQFCLPRQLLDDTLDFLKDPALFSKLDASDKLSEPVNPLNFQLRNTSALELIDDSKYRSWLTRTAQEILYWTALQPCEVTDPCASPLSGECYSEHLKQKGCLDKTLYPKPLHPLEIQKKFPRDFCRANGQLNLGAINAVFPLVALARGLTRLVSNIFAYAAQYSKDESME